MQTLALKVREQIDHALETKLEEFSEALRDEIEEIVEDKLEDAIEEIVDQLIQKAQELEEEKRAQEERLYRQSMTQLKQRASAQAVAKAESPYNAGPGGPMDKMMKKLKKRGWWK